jgi:multisubunit Na+/H+ antiporter MnhE subunit
MEKKTSSFVIATAAVITMGFWVLFTGSWGLHELILGAAFTVLTRAIRHLPCGTLGIIF